MLILRPAQMKHAYSPARCDIRCTDELGMNTVPVAMLHMRNVIVHSCENYTRVSLRLVYLKRDKWCAFLSPRHIPADTSHAQVLSESQRKGKFEIKGDYLMILYLQKGIFVRSLISWIVFWWEECKLQYLSSSYFERRGYCLDFKGRLRLMFCCSNYGFQCQCSKHLGMYLSFMRS